MDEKYKNIGDLQDRVIEECSEVIHAICKSRRFGLNSFHPKTPNIKNYNLIINEIYDAMQVLNQYLVFLSNYKILKREKK